MLNMKRWLSDKSSFDSPDWTFLIVTILISLFLFFVIHKTWIRGTFDLTNWPQAEGKWTEKFAIERALTPDPNKRMALQQQRVLYPMLVHVVAFGSPVYVPALLIFLNAIGLCVLAWLSGMFAQTINRHALWGLLIPLYPGFLLSVRSYSPEIIEVCFLLGSLLCLRRSKHIIATILLSAAVLTKESALLMVAAAACTYLIEWRRPPRTIKWFYFTIPLVIMAVWEAILFRAWGMLPLALNSHEIGLPLAGFVRLLKSSGPSMFTIVLLIGLAGLFLFSAIQSRRAPLPLHEKAAFWIYGCWLFCLNGYVFNSELNFLRAASEFYLLAVTIVVLQILHARITIGEGVVLLWFYFAHRLAQPFY